MSNRQYFANKKAKYSATSSGANLTSISAVAPAATSPAAGATLNGLCPASSASAGRCSVARGTGRGLADATAASSVYRAAGDTDGLRAVGCGMGIAGRVEPSAGGGDPPAPTAALTGTTSLTALLATETLLPSGRARGAGVVGCAAVGRAVAKSIAVCWSISSMCQSYSRSTTPVFSSDSLHAYTSSSSSSSSSSLFVYQQNNNRYFPIYCSSVSAIHNHNI